MDEQRAGFPKGLGPNWKFGLAIMVGVYTFVFLSWIAAAVFAVVVLNSHWAIALSLFLAAAALAFFGSWLGWRSLQRRRLRDV